MFSMAQDDAAYAVDLLGAWVDAGAPDGNFEYVGQNGDTFTGIFSQDILPLFTEENIWFDGAASCSSCHHENLETSYHEMDLTSHKGILSGADVMEHPPGVPLLGESAIGETDYDWDHSKLIGRLRNTRMPPGTPFDITEENRDGPKLSIHGEEVNAVDLLSDWVAAGLPETASFGSYKATFSENVLALFTEEDAWFDGSASCSSCHHENLETSYHEMDLTSYKGILAGADVLEKAPGVALFGESAIGETDYDWEHSKLKARLRNNRMPPGMPFDITEENRDGPLVLHGVALNHADVMTESSSEAIATLVDVDMAEVNDLVASGGCAACHTIPEVENAVGTLGPSWCESAEEYQEGEVDLAFLLRAITDPNADVGEGDLAGVMPQDFGTRFNQDELNMLVSFIATLRCE